jgi:hypothetical protein
LTLVLAASLSLQVKAEHACTSDAMKWAKGLQSFHVQDSGADAQRIEIAQEAKVLKLIGSAATDANANGRSIYRC